MGEYSNVYSPSSTAVRYGFAIGSEKVSFGFAGITAFDGYKNGSDFNIGFLLNPAEVFSLGATLMRLSGGPNEVGLGASFAAGKGFALICDTTIHLTDWSGYARVALKPGIKVGTKDAAIALTYGTDYSEQIDKDVGISVSATLGTSSLIEGYYNHGGEHYNYGVSLGMGF
jgi:hypothetical protein